MIPDFTPAGVLPPYLGNPATGARAPYPTTMDEVVQRLGDTPHRLSIIEGLLAYRDDLRSAGFSAGLQWLDGSFMERKVPNDIDVVTWVSLHLDATQQATLLGTHPHLFDPAECKAKYKTDADPITMITYWYGLFSHQRDTDRWKGMLAVDLADTASDASARALIAARRAA
jgi:hypothetical protein